MKWMLAIMCLAGGPDCALKSGEDLTIRHFRTEAECVAHGAEITRGGGSVQPCYDACLGGTALERSACAAPEGACGTSSALEPGGRWCVADWKRYLREYVLAQ